MLGKLLKYDLRSMFKQFAIVWPAALALALVNRFTLKSFIASASTKMNIFSGIMMLVFVVTIAAMFILSLIFIIQRFYKGLLGSEGYLMHTLPVRSWQLITSKLVCAVVVTVVSVLVAVASFVLLLPLDLADLQAGWRTFLQGTEPDLLAFLAGLLLFSLLDTVRNFLAIYLAIAIGHLFNSHRVAWSFVAYVAVSSVTSGFLTLLDRIFTPGADEALMGLIFGTYTPQTMPAVSPSESSFWISALISQAVTVIYFLAANYILSRRLNLE